MPSAVSELTGRSWAQFDWSRHSSVYGSRLESAERSAGDALNQKTHYSNELFAFTMTPNTGSTTHCNIRQSDTVSTTHCNHEYTQQNSPEQRTVGSMTHFPLQQRKQFAFIATQKTSESIHCNTMVYHDALP